MLTSDHIERAVSLYASGLSCASVSKELQVNRETVRQALLKAGVAMRRPGRPPRAMESRATPIGDTNQNEKSVLLFRSTTEQLGLATVEPTGIWSDFPAVGPRCRVDLVSDK